MSASNWIRSVCQRARGPRGGASQGCRHWKGMDPLESRTLFATVTWDGGGGNGNWFTPANWSANALPTANDDVVISSPSVPVFFTTAATVTINKLILSNAELGVLGGTLRVFQAPGLIGGTLLAGGDSALTIDGGTVAVQTSATFDASELEINEGDLTSPATVIRNGFLNLYADGTGDFVLRGTSYLAGDIGEDRVVTIQGIAALPATIYWAAGERLNEGAITLTSSAGVAVTLRMVGTLINSGTISFNVGSGGSRKFTGDLINYGGLGGGVVNVNASTTFGGPGSSYANIGGSITVAAAAALTIAAPNSVFAVESGTFAVSGTFTMAGNNGTFDYQGGTITGTPLVMLGATLSLGPAATGAAHFQMRGACTLQGVVKPGQSVTIQGVTALGARVEWESGLINNGTITLTSTFAAHALLVSELAPINNQGTLNSLAGAGGNRTITGGLTNFGTISLGTGTTFAGDNVLYTFNPTGTVTGSGALILSTIGRVLGGTVSGTGNLSVTESGRLFIAVSGTLATARPVNNRGEIWVDGGTFNPTGGILQLTNGLLTGGLWNVRGSAVINFPSVVRTIGPAASVGVLGTTATFNALNTLRRVDGELAIGAGRNLVLNPFGGAFTNNGTLRVEAGGTLTLGAGSYAQTSAATLNLDIAGVATTAFGRIVTTGAASLAGSLISNFVSGFAPVAGNQFQFLTAGSRAGTFPLTYLPAAPATVVQYLANGARLSVS